MNDHALGLHGALTRRDAVAAIGAYGVRQKLALGEWRSPWPGVLVPASRSADPVTLAAAAVLVAGPEAVLSDATAAYLHGCTAASPVPIHVTVPYGHCLRSRSGLIVHNRRLREEESCTIAGLPVLGLHETVADLLCTARQPDALAVADQAFAAVEEPERERLRAAIDRHIADRPDPRGRRRGARLLQLATGRADSPAESWLLWRIVNAGYPTPEVNWPILDTDGRALFRLDLAWPDLRIALEHDGYAVHLGQGEADEMRRADLRRRGWIVVVALAADHGDLSRVERELDGAFRRRGVDMSRRTVGVLRARSHRDRRAS